MQSRIVIPLDGLDKKGAFELAELLKGLVWGFKVNDLLVECGTRIIEELKSYGKVFADAKLHDIPNTVANQITRLSQAGADLITVHASGGLEMLSRARDSRGSSRILAVTVLTSINEESCRSLFGASPSDVVLRLARLAKASGVDGIVCSPNELAALSSEPSLSGLLRVTPGIRPNWYGKSDDQMRTDTPSQAVKLGAGLLVIGRPITGHRDPLEAVRLINREVEEVSSDAR